MIVFSSAEADQHENVRQAVIRKRRGFSRVDERKSSVFERTYTKI